MATFSLGLLTQNTQMIAARKGDKPRDWAGYIGNNFDVACLQEAFTNRAVRRLVDCLDPEPNVHEKNKGTKIPSSGLATLVFRRSITRKRWWRFNRQAGWDRWAKKGVILTEIELGPGAGTLQVYNTHLNAARDRPRLDYREERLVTVRQCFELAKFVVQTRRPEASAIVCGDLNLDGENDTRFPVTQILSDGHRRGLPDRFWSGFEGGQGPTVRRSLTHAVPADYGRRGRFGGPVSTKTQYQLLVDLFRVLGFTDAWGETTRNRCYTTKLGRRDGEKKGPGLRDYKLRMPILATPDPKDRRFAQDSPMIAPAAKRLDYVFHAPGDGTGPTTSRVASMRRTYIPEPGQDAGLPATELDWLSDHVGLYCSLVFGGASRSRRVKEAARVTVVRRALGE